MHIAMMRRSRNYKDIMTAVSENPKLLLLVTAIILFTTASGIYLYSKVLKSADEIIQDNMNFTQTAAAKLILDGNHNIEPVWKAYLDGKDRISKAEEREADSLLSASVQEVLNNFHLVEGGFYFYTLDAFIGYGFPTIKEPKPAFGPPPRSYHIIRDQVRQTIEDDTFLTNIHRFDPAIFPLTTQPVYLNGEIIGAVWTRIHLERKLNTVHSIQSGTFFFTLGGILLVLVMITFLYWLRKKRLEEIQSGLSIMKHDPEYRLKEQSGIFGYISHAINDMTDTQQREQIRRKKLKRDLFQKEKMAALGNLIAGTAHEINTPISIIKTRIQIWERAIQKNESQPVGGRQIISDKSLQVVHNEINRVSRLIKRLLVFSKPAANNKQKTDLYDVIEKQIARCREAFPDTDIFFYFDKSETLPHIHADRESLGQVFINLFKNSVEACSDIPEITIHVDYQRENEQIEIRIQDNGPGIDPAVFDKIFDPFFTTNYSGSGLGLSICHEIVKAHGGSIYFELPQTKSETDFVNNKSPYQTKTAGACCILTFPAAN